MRERCGCALDGEETCAGRRWPERCRRRPEPGYPLHGLRGGVDPASERLGQVSQQHLSRARDHVGALWLQLVRSSLLCVSTLIFVMALRYVPLPTATAISFTSPFIVTALAPLLLGEAVGRYRWCAVVIGFLGALIVVRPGITGTNEAAFLIFGSALASALYQILSRKLAAHDEAETSITYIALAGFL